MKCKCPPPVKNRYILRTGALLVTQAVHAPMNAELVEPNKCEPPEKCKILMEVENTFIGKSEVMCIVPARDAEDGQCEELRHDCLLAGRC